MRCTGRIQYVYVRPFKMTKLIFVDYNNCRLNANSECVIHSYLRTQPIIIVNLNVRVAQTFNKPVEPHEPGPIKYTHT